MELLFSIGNPTVCGKKCADIWFTSLRNSAILLFKVIFSTWVNHHFAPPFGRICLVPFFGASIILCGTPTCRQPIVVSYIIFMDWPAGITGNVS